MTERIRAAPQPLLFKEHWTDAQTGTPILTHNAQLKDFILVQLAVHSEMQSTDRFAAV